MAAALVPCSLAGTRAEVGRAACTVGQHDVGRRPGKAAALLWRAAVTWGKETPALARATRKLARIVNKIVIGAVSKSLERTRS